MTRHLSVAGKGGTGKTTLCSLLIKWLRDNKKTPVLAVDADPNSNLGEALGLLAEGSVADILVAARDSREIPAGMSRDMFVEYRLNAALTESTGVDMLVMGGPEGPGCYCYPNDVLKRYVEKLSSNYRWLVMDNEAGLEHLSRRIAADIDILLVVSDPTARGIRSAGRVARLTAGLQLEIGRQCLVINRADAADLEQLEPEIRATGLELAPVIPSDQQIHDLDLRGRPLVEVDRESAVWQAVCRLAEFLEL